MILGPGFILNMDMAGFNPPIDPVKPYYWLSTNGINNGGGAMTRVCVMLSVLHRLLAVSMTV